MFEKELENAGISLVTPNNTKQKELSRLILRIINNKADKKDKKFIITLINSMKKQGVEAIILGCTDLPLIVKRGDSIIPIINSLEVLEDSAIKFLA